MRGLVLAYHSQNCGGYDYGSNDHLAFERDLRAVLARDLPIVSLADIASALAAGLTAQLPDRFVAFSCDDGSLLDWRDYEHPRFGPQRSFANILREQVARHGLTGKGLLTAFVIASPVARRAIDEGCYGGAPLSHDDWWTEAAREGLLAIENHSWDHLHTVLPASLLPDGGAGNFHTVDNYPKADLQVRAAAEFIDEQLAATGQRTSLFAYPYGHASAFLAREYLPRYAHEHGVVGAFTTEQNFVDAGTRAFEIPRMVCGDAWRTHQQFAELLERLLGE
ncbi:MAG: polysaccharide deacetylase family protein [Halioglobus sp.]